jgi:hypothetical protein
LKIKTTIQHSVAIFGILVSISFGFPALEEHAPYCIYWKNKKIELPLPKRGSVHVVAGESIVFQFGKWMDANKTEYESHYLIELDSAKKHFPATPQEKYSMISCGGSAAKVLPRVKIKGAKATDSTWVINEWFSPQYDQMFGTLPDKLRKKDKREIEGYRLS